MNDDDQARLIGAGRRRGEVEVLIEVDELAELIGGDSPPVLADVRWRLGGPPGRPAFEAGHLPGAQYVDLESELSAPHDSDPSVARAGGRHPLPTTEAFQEAMRRIGVQPESLVVVYDDANALAAARLWWLLGDAGHERVRVLNGGWGAWRAAGGSVQTGPADPVAAGAFSARPGRHASIDAASLADRLAAGAVPTVADVRGYERFTGATEPMDPVAGHIPGAVSAPSTENLDRSGRFRPAAEIADRYRALDRRGEAIFYCGSGITAAHTLLARKAAGLPDGLIYAGSWSDWISDPTRPVATGEGERY